MEPGVYRAIDLDELEHWTRDGWELVSFVADRAIVRTIPDSVEGALTARLQQLESELEASRSEVSGLKSEADFVESRRRDYERRARELSTVEMRCRVLEAGLRALAATEDDVKGAIETALRNTGLAREQRKVTDKDVTVLTAAVYEALTVGRPWRG